MFSDILTITIKRNKDKVNKSGYLQDSDIHVTRILPLFPCPPPPSGKELPPDKKFSCKPRISATNILLEIMENIVFNTKI